MDDCWFVVPARFLVAYPLLALETDTRYSKYRGPNCYAWRDGAERNPDDKARAHIRDRKGWMDRSRGQSSIVPSRLKLGYRWNNFSVSAGLNACDGLHGARQLSWAKVRGFMKIRQIVLCLSLALAFDATSRPSHAAGCTEAKSKADKQRINPLFERGELRRTSTGSLEVSLAYWRGMSDAQKRAFADGVICAEFGPGGGEWTRFVVLWKGSLAIVAVWLGGRLHIEPISSKIR